MKYAIVNGERQEAQPKLSGKCELHGCSVIAKCGKVKIWHWAHVGQQNCDPSKESETPWHRAWKDCFPKEWQEVVHVAENGDKHRADVKTDQGYAIEFQHSPIKFEERQSREDFYKAMIWIVNGLRQPNDKEKFIHFWRCTVPIKEKVEIWKFKGSIEKCPLLRDWADSNAPVFFDLGEDFLLGLLPKDFSEEERYLVGIERKTLVASLHRSPEKSFKRLWIDWAFSIVNSQPKKTVSPQAQQSNHSPSRYGRRHFRL